MDLLSNLWMAVESMPNLKGVQMIPVDLSEACLEFKRVRCGIGGFKHHSSAALPPQNWDAKHSPYFGSQIPMTPWGKAAAGSSVHFVQFSRECCVSAYSACTCCFLEDSPSQGLRIMFSAEDMGEFIAAVQNRFVFQTCVSRRLLASNPVDVEGGYRR